jgi:Domain of unknown function (DUF4268)
MTVPQLGKLIRLNPRTVWSHEATDFTPWLQQNIDQLAATVGIDVQLVEREVAVGDFSVDLVGEEPGSSRPVIIENQLEPTDHRHLGQLLNYAAGKDGGVIIWVARQIRPEHQNALEWLNNATQGNIDFFGVELEILQIEGSPLKATNFKAVVAPKNILSLRSPQDNGRGQRYQAFSQDLLDRIKFRQPGITNQRSVGIRSYLPLRSGRSGFTYSLTFTTGSRIRIEIYISTGDGETNKQAFDNIHSDKASIEEQIGATLDWERLDNRQASRIAWYWGKTVTIMDSSEKLEELKSWAVDSYFKFRTVSQPLLENLDLDNLEYKGADPSAIALANEDVSV